MGKLSLAWLIPASRKIDEFTNSELKRFYNEAFKKGFIDRKEAAAELEKALKHKTDFVTALKITIPINWRSSVSYRFWKSRGKKPGFSTIIETLRDRRMYELATTFAIALKSGDIRDEAFDEKDRLKPEEYEFKIRVADNLEKLVNERVKKIHREGFAEKYFKGREEVFNFELKDLEYSEMFRNREYDKILSSYNDLKNAWHGKTAGIGERVVSLTLFEAALLDEEPEACEAIIRYEWAITNVWMWSDELKDLLNDLKDGSINMLLVECLKRGLKNVDENSVLGFIARNPNVLDEPVQEYIELTRETGEKLKLYPWINFKDYVEGSGIVFSKLEERKKKLLKAVESSTL
ncbi:MAG: hypothetical protein FGF52_04080 [Candidatus Brockarchaeota archaeon]|nr:hypothetical protein [Candidatus Brockarchaeota archaeon]